MASLDDGRRAYIQLSDNESGSSYLGSDAPVSESENVICQWRTDEFHDQECSRYLDCPSHVVEREFSHTLIHQVDGEDDDESMDNPADDASIQIPVEAQRSSTSLSTSSSSDSSGDVMEIDQPARSRSSGARLGTESNPIDISEDDTSGQQTAAIGAIVISDHENDADDESGEDTDNPTASTAMPIPSTSETVPRADSTPETSNPELIPRIQAPEEDASTSRPTLRSAPPDIVLPRWQPDAEVTYCPICHTQFSIFVRKHHCRSATGVPSKRQTGGG
jgi:hypothetical protein